MKRACVACIVIGWVIAWAGFGPAGALAGDGGPASRPASRPADSNTIVLKALHEFTQTGKDLYANRSLTTAQRYPLLLEAYKKLDAAFRGRSITLTLTIKDVTAGKDGVAKIACSKATIKSNQEDVKDLVTLAWLFPDLKIPYQEAVKIPKGSEMTVTGVFPLQTSLVRGSTMSCAYLLVMTPQVWMNLPENCTIQVNGKVRARHRR